MRWWIALLGALLAVPVSAQIQDAATDAELFAGYCFAASTLSGFMGKFMAVKDCDGADSACLEVREMGATLQRGQEAIHKRVNDYLNARRLFQERSQSIAMAGVQRAMEAAGDDVKACTGNGTGRGIKPDACERLKRCNDLSRLPM
jgi:hypothetical protein